MLSFKTLFTLALVMVAVQAAAVPSKFLSVDDVHLSEGLKTNFVMELQGSGGIAPTPNTDPAFVESMYYFDSLTSTNVTTESAILHYTIKPEIALQLENTATSVFYFVTNNVAPAFVLPGLDVALSDLENGANLAFHLTHGKCDHDVFYPTLVTPKPLAGSCFIPELANCTNCKVFVGLGSFVAGVGTNFFESEAIAQKYPTPVIIATIPAMPTLIRDSMVETTVYVAPDTSDTVSRTWDFDVNLNIVDPAANVSLVYRFHTCCYVNGNQYFQQCGDLPENHECETPWRVIGSGLYKDGTTNEKGKFWSTTYPYLWAQEVDVAPQVGVYHVVQPYQFNRNTIRNIGPIALYIAVYDKTSGLISEFTPYRVADILNDVTPPVVSAVTTLFERDIEITTWTASDGVDMYGYAIPDGQLTNQPTAEEVVAVGNGTVIANQVKTRQKIVGLIPGREYMYCVAGQNFATPPLLSNVVCHTFFYPDFVAPTYTITATPLETSIVIAGQVDEVATMSIFVSNTGDVVDVETDLAAGSQFETNADGSFTFTQTSCVHSTAYTIYMQGVDQQGNVGTVTMLDVVTPAPPPNTQKYETIEDATVVDALAHGSEAAVTAALGGARVLFKTVIPTEANALSMAVTFSAITSEVGSTFSLFKVTQPWTEASVNAVCAAPTGVDAVGVERCSIASTWDIMTGAASVAAVASATDVAIVDGQLVFDIQADAAAFTSTNNFGWVIVATAGSATFASAQAAANAPFLSITYNWDATVGTTCGPACDSSLLDLDCGADFVYVNTASFGRSNTGTCPGSTSAMNQVCTGASTDVTFVVGKECNGKKACQILADSALFVSPATEPCAGTSKYLIGSYSCLSALASHCDTSPCQNGGVCQTTASAYVCSCPTGFEGVDCATVTPPAPTGLIAYYPFESGTPIDTVGGHHGVVSGSVAYTEGVEVLGSEDSPQGLVVGVYSSDSVVSVPTATALQFTDKFSLSFWFKPTKTASLDTDGAAGTDFATTCEGKSLSLSCPAGSSIKVTAASYGRSDYTTCVHRSMKTDQCHSEKSVAFVASQCDGKTSCNVRVTNSGFGDPCYGTYKYLTGKYLCQADARTEVLVSQGVFGSGSTQGRAGFGIYTVEDKDGYSAVSVRLERERGRQTLTAAGVSDDEWHFVAVTFNADVQTLYVDGQAVVDSRKNKAGGIKPSQGGLFFGADTLDTTKTQANAVLDEIKVFDVSLTTAEVSKLRSAGVGTEETPDLYIPEDKVEETEDINEEVFSPSVAGCADGSREGFKNIASYPQIAACVGGWSIPGVATPASFSRACNAQSGNDGEIEGCTVADTCAVGWHVCKSAAEVRYKTRNEAEELAVHGTSNTGCDAVNDFETGFFVTRQSGSGYAICGAEGTNDVFGCGSVGSHIQTNCQGLQSFTHNLCSKVKQAGFQCSANGGEAEALSITHDTNVEGGAMCCKDDRYQNSVPAKKADHTRIEIAVVNEPEEEEVDEEQCRMIGRHISKAAKSKKKKSKKARGSHGSVKSAKFKCMRVRKSCKSNKSQKSAGSGKSNKKNHRGRRLLQASTVTYSYLMFDIAPSLSFDAVTLDNYMNDMINVEGIAGFPTVDGLDKIQTVDVLKDCADGSSQYTCAFVPNVVTLPLPAGLSTANNGYPVEDTFVLSNDSPVVIALIVTLVVIVVLVLLGAAYRFKYAKNNVEHSFDASIMNSAKPRSDEVELSAAASAAPSEQDTYWVFNRAQNQNQDVRVVV